MRETETQSLARTRDIPRSCRYCMYEWDAPRERWLLDEVNLRCPWHGREWRAMRALDESELA